MTRTSPPRWFGVSYPIRKSRILFSTLLLFVVLYFLGSILILIPALFFVSAYGTGGWLITVVLITSGIALIAYRGYRETLRRVLADAE
jgi:hypothetical protein